MSPTLMDGDIVVLNRMNREYRTGDIVSMRVPSGDYYVKRVIACGGDVVDLDGGRVLAVTTAWSRWTPEPLAK